MLGLALLGTVALLISRRGALVYVPLRLPD